MKISIFSSCGRNFRHTTQPRNPTLKELAPALQKCTFHHHIAQKSLSCADTPHSHTRTFAHGLDQRRARGVPSPCPEPPFSPFSLKKKNYSEAAGLSQYPLSHSIPSCCAVLSPSKPRSFFPPGCYSHYPSPRASSIKAPKDEPPKHQLLP